MIIEQFINEKITQIRAYITAVINHSLHYTELDQFVDNTMAEWTLLHVSDETPSNARERVFWHIMHELSLHSANDLERDLYFKSEISTCLDFFSGTGSYPIDCIGWRPLP
ncbi:hypothetical protein [Cognaticolwellia beringensis]|uniref:Uncharacterized protein n=1 Tax=Cognaticolwellia beringensis TaxID=1967665 RepID=A0A222G4E6_9GAMM|nr:hypothetical protein [Cognaticolwellia beringensis]ASP46785.1 hypothetical protein B5D82_02700 [Cognaticolwellia beringensis]|tara:strand:+ start:2618 stop:2947 length:330 start_codon:yes stop_codon:yes gene_type:complete